MHSSTPIRLVATIMGWALLMAVVVLTAQLISPSFGALMKIVMLFVTLIGIMLFGSIWTWGQLSNLSNQEDSSEAVKRKRLATALRELSDSELVRLRQRLSSGDIDDEQLSRLLDESEASKAKRA